MEIKGVIKKIFDVESGISKAGKEWKKQSVLIERPHEQFNKEICIEAFGDEKIQRLNKFSEGDAITIACNVYSREYNGKYFHNIQGYWFANKNSEVAMENTDDNEDLPF
jgi:hypothetical protein